MPSRQTLSGTTFPTSVSATRRGNRRICVIGFIELKDDVPVLNLRLFRRPSGNDARDEGTHRLLQPKCLGDLFVDRLNTHAKPATLDLTVLYQLLNDWARTVGRNGEADADATA